MQLQKTQSAIGNDGIADDGNVVPCIALKWLRTINRGVRKQDEAGPFYIRSLMKCNVHERRRRSIQQQEHAKKERSYTLDMHQHSYTHSYQLHILKCYMYAYCKQCMGIEAVKTAPPPISWNTKTDHHNNACCMPIWNSKRVREWNRVAESHTLPFHLRIVGHGGQVAIFRKIINDIKRKKKK